MTLVNRLNYKFLCLDRDGIINKDIGHLHKISGFEYRLGFLDFIVNVKDYFDFIFIITNQAGLAKDYYSYSDYLALMSYIVSDLGGYNVEISDVFHCPHHPAGKISKLSHLCSCRKPSSLLFRQLAEKYMLLNNNGVFIGNKISDYMAAKDFDIDFLYIPDDTEEEDLALNHNLTICDFKIAQHLIEEKFKE